MSPANPPSQLTQSQITDLQQRAAEVAQRAYAPYSHYRVGAAILLNDADGTIVTGCNIENASYRLTVCAEQAAIATAVSLDGPGLRILAIAIANLNDAPSAPCGACRQTILEFSTPDTVVFFQTKHGIFARSSIADLLPFAFLLPVS